MDYVLWALLILVLLLIVLFVLPLSVRVEYNKELRMRLYYAGICLKDTKKHKKPKKKKAKDNKPSFQTKITSFFEKLKKERGFKGSIEYCTAVLKVAFRILRGFLKHIKISDINLKITVGGTDAAETAISYGAVCAAVYPTISFIASKTELRTKHIDVFSDFSKTESSVFFSFKITVNLFTGLLFELSKDGNFKKIIKECEKL